MKTTLRAGAFAGLAATAVPRAGWFVAARGVPRYSAPTVAGRAGPTARARAAARVTGRARRGPLCRPMPKHPALTDEEVQGI